MNRAPRRRLRPDVKTAVLEHLDRDDAPPVDGLERKAVYAAPMKIEDEDQGIATVFPSVTGVVDEVADEIQPGAYTDTLKVRWPRGISDHMWDKKVAKSLEAVELLPGDPGLPKTQPNGEPWPASAGALRVTAQYNLKTQLGRDTWENIKFFGADQEWSIGYKVPKGGAATKAGVRYIKTIDLYEFSDVLFGAMPLARTGSLKAHPVTLLTPAEHARGEVKWLFGSDIPGSAEWVRDQFNGLQVPVDGLQGHGHVIATFPGYVLLGNEVEHGAGEIGPRMDRYFQVSYVIEDGQVRVTGTEPVDITTTVTPRTVDVPPHVTAYDEPTVDAMVDVAAEYAAMASLRG